MSEQSTVKIGWHIDKELYKKMKKVAKINNMNTTEYYRNLLSEHVEDNEELIGKYDNLKAN